MDKIGNVLNFISFPRDVLENIFSLLLFIDIMCVCTVCKHVKLVAEDPEVRNAINKLDFRLKLIVLNPSAAFIYNFCFENNGGLMTYYKCVSDIDLHHNFDYGNSMFALQRLRELKIEGFIQFSLPFCSTNVIIIMDIKCSQDFVNDAANQKHLFLKERLQRQILKTTYGIK